MLDSLQAPLTALPEPSNSVVILERSQGAHAPLSASLLDHECASDVHLKGTVATRVPSSPPFAPETRAPTPTAPGVGGVIPACNLLNLLTYRIIEIVLESFGLPNQPSAACLRGRWNCCLTGVVQ